jgi:hypothetical protein
MKNYIGPLLGMVLVSLSGTTATAQQKNSEPATACLRRRFDQAKQVW